MLRCTILLSSFCCSGIRKMYCMSKIWSNNGKLFFPDVVLRKCYDRNNIPSWPPLTFEIRLMEIDDGKYVRLTKYVWVIG